MKQKINHNLLIYFLDGFEKFNKLKHVNSRLKTLLAVGGWNEDSSKYSRVAANSSFRRNMITSTIDLLLKYGFDGFDLDWEYPAQRGGSPNDKTNFATLIKEFRKEFDKHGLLLTAAVGASATTINLSYDVPELVKYLHWFNVMTYDMHGPWEHHTGINAPLYASSKDNTPQEKELNVDACIKAWINAGVPPEKLVMGLGFYGKSFTLSNSHNHGLHAPIVSPGPAGPITAEPGMYAYYEVIINLSRLKTINRLINYIN